MEYDSSKPIKSFRDLRVWRESYHLTIEIYAVVRTFPQSERYVLVSQMTRAAISVSSNIAEGFGRRSRREKDQFYSVANGSLTELENQLLVARGIGILGEDRFSQVAERCATVHRMLSGLQKANKRPAAIR